MSAAFGLEGFSNSLKNAFFARSDVRIPSCSSISCLALYSLILGQIQTYFRVSSPGSCWYEMSKSKATDKFPTIIFESSSVRKNIKGYEVTGKLTLKGITKEINFPFIFEGDTFIGTFSIAAKDFNINREGAVPSGQIRIELTIPVTK